MKFDSRLKRIHGKIVQLFELPPSMWVPFVQSWLARKKSGFVNCIFPRTRQLVCVELKDFYESYSFFVESKNGRREISFFLSKMKTGDVLFDIGGFRGAYAAAVKALLGDRCKVFVFEPLPRNCESIERMRVLNEFNDFELIRSAVSNSDILRGGVNEIDGMLRSGDHAVLAETEFRSCSLDEFSSSRNVDPTVLKVDVDGFEWEVLQGAQNCLRRCRPRLWLEVHPTYLQNKARDWKDVIRFVESLGYRTSYFEDYKSKDRDISFHVWCE